MLDTGDHVPADLPLALSSGESTTLAAYRGHWLVLYFYPKDNTPGCTTESRDFTSLLPQFDASNARILGVSRDSVKTHQNFIAKQALGFALVSDADEALCNAFGVIREKNMYGRKVMGIVRSTYLINPAGVIAHTWQPVKVPGHAQAVLEVLLEHAGTAS